MQSSLHFFVPPVCQAAVGIQRRRGFHLFCIAVANERFVKLLFAFSGVVNFTFAVQLSQIRQLFSIKKTNTRSMIQGRERRSNSSVDFWCAEHNPSRWYVSFVWGCFLWTSVMIVTVVLQDISSDVFAEYNLVKHK